jgi:UDP-glucose 4-epimerase
MDAPAVVRRRVPGYETKYERRGWSMLPSIDRVYVNERARSQLGWQPRYGFAHLIDRLKVWGSDPRATTGKCSPTGRIRSIDFAWMLPQMHSR